MITKQIIKRSIEELAVITGVKLAVYDDGDNLIARTEEDWEPPFDGRLSVEDDDQVRFTIAAEGEGREQVSRIAAAQLRELMTAYREKLDAGSFFQNLLLDNLLLVDIYQRAKKLHIDDKVRRVVYLIDADAEAATGYLSGMFTPKSKDHVTTIDERSVIVIKALDPSDDKTAMEDVASSIVGLLNTEAMVKARVAYGTPVTELRDLSRSYKEALLALDVGRIFYEEKSVIAYSALGIGRLIYQLPANLCRVFISEAIGSGEILEFDEETRTTVDAFYENGLNVSETARKLFLHRNTLVYRLDKLQKDTGLDIRTFDGALTLKMSMMVYNYLKYLDSKSY